MSGKEIEALYPSYNFLPDGKVYIKKYKKFMKMCNDKDGYSLIGLTDVNGKRSSKRAHRIIASIYIPNPENKPFVNHKDGNKKNNNISNLEWCTAKENTDHAIKMKLTTYIGSENYNSKLTDVDVYRIRELYSSQMLTEAEIGKLFNVTQNLISKIITRANWKHI